MLPFPVVCIGASAGGLQARTRLLEGLPVDTGMAFVLVSHLSPSHASHLAALSGYSGEETRRRAREAQFDEYVIKPVDADALEEMLRHQAR